MLGWEFPPFFAGGVGIVCYELTKILSTFDDIKITYVMPYGSNERDINKNLKIKILEKNDLTTNSKKDNLIIKHISSEIYAYESSYEYSRKVFFKYKKIVKNQRKNRIKNIYGLNLIQEVFLYAKKIVDNFYLGDFDIIHSHDWTTFPAGIMLKEITKKPLIIHVHITELDKTGGAGGNSEIFKIEREGFLMADKIICVSEFTKNRLVYNYGVDASKIEVIYNGGITDLKFNQRKFKPQKKEKVVLFAGRITLQKGVEYFIRAAKKVLEYDKNVRFIIAGTGDKLEEMIQLTKDLEIENKVFFYGFYSRKQADELFSLANVFVMSSVSEPFGIVPLEAVAKGTPTIISKQSGISEILDHSFKVDFWDIDEMAHKILALLKYDILNNVMSKNAQSCMEDFSWDKTGRQVYNLYKKVLNLKDM